MTDLYDHVLIVDDEVIIAQSLGMQIEDMGIPVCGTAATAEEAIALAQEHRPRVVLMDVRLRGDHDGVHAACAIHAAVGSKVIFITGSSEPATIGRIQRDHPAAVLFKPVSDQQLRSAIAAVLAADQPTS